MDKMDLIFNLLFCILGIAGGTVVTIIKEKRKKLARKIFTVNLISEEVSTINGLEIKYNSSSIKKLYSSTIQIKNTGNTAIKNDDISKKCPLSIHTDGMFIVDKYEIQSPNPDNENDIKIEFLKNGSDKASSAIIDFEFIKPKQVAAVTLLHTGKISLDKWIIIDGKVSDSKEVLDEMDSQNHPTILKLSKLSICITCILLIFMILFYVSVNSLKAQNNQMMIHIEKLQEEIKDLEDETENQRNIIYRLFPRPNPTPGIEEVEE